MKQERPPFPEQLFYEGDVALGHTLKSQIKHEEALFQIEKKNLFLKEELDSRRSNLRSYEEEIDLREKKIKQEITDLRTDTCLRLLEIQKETESIIQLHDAAIKTLKNVRKKAQKNQKIIDDEKEKILNAQNFEITTTQYNELLQEQNQNLKNDIIFNNNDYQIKAQITWYSNEYYALDSKISKVASRLPLYDSNIKLLSLKIDKKVQRVQQLNAAKHEIKKNYPQKDEILLNQKKIKQLQKESRRILNIVREFHEIQRNLVSRISNMTAKYVKYDVLLQKIGKYINHAKTRDDPNKSFVFHKMIIDDDNLRSDEIIKNNSDKICRISNSIKEQRLSLERQISETISASNGHKETIIFLRELINDYSNQQNILNEQLIKYQELSDKYDQKYQKINEKINKVNNYLNEIKQQQKNIPEFVEPPLRSFQHELNQIHSESNLKLKINYILDQISLLKHQISRYEKGNRFLQQKSEKNKDFQNQNSMQNAKIQINKLRPLIINLESSISKKTISISKKKDRIKYKKTVIDNAQQCIKENDKRLIAANNASKQKMKFNDIEKWIVHIEREILKWELEKIDESIFTYLNKWNQKLPDLPEYTGTSD